jgi:hypothetical protein
MRILSGRHEAVFICTSCGDVSEGFALTIMGEALCCQSCLLRAVAEPGGGYPTTALALGGMLGAADPGVVS